ncbi:alpha/beta hydrolase family protein [Kitasatospora sp. CB01950]|uniref:alpha/beta hydrolase family protein n=1 Tax=Kitasatospora sp. CB01950 TaxID=1703930 RepID=UPI00093B910F|nr:esterase [Kitasatospora sp. CB01950]OKJ05584.1 esterase [Kitasatospora sp. CB01950]
MGRRGRAMAAAVLAATVALGVAGAPGAMAQTVGRQAPAGQLATATLPAPTGPYAVGTTSVHLVDQGREDPWKAGRPRELMISLWYPTARPASGTDRVPYMTPDAGAHFGSAGSVGWMNERFEPDRTDWSGVRTHARVDAPALPGRVRPVVLYSAGLGDPRTWGTGLVEDLASRGYVVVTVDHTWEASEVSLPGGELATSVFPELAQDPALDMGALLRKMIGTRVDDTRFVLDELARLKDSRTLPPGVGAALDLGRIGMVGHSGGGSTALQAMHDDPRISAAVNMDGQLHFPGSDGRTGVYLTDVAEKGLDRPFLLLGTRNGDSGPHQQQPGWEALWQHSTGWHADFTLDGSRHASYTDAESLLPQLARQGAISAEALHEGVGDIRPDRAVLATRTYVASFFDRWLRGHDDHLLDGPSGNFPEMVYEP